jgi:hypothetical protein
VGEETSPQKENRLFFQIKYHSRDISKMEIRNAYKETCELPIQGYDSKGFKNLITEHGEEIKTDRVTVCYHRAKNIHDHLIPSKLFETEFCNVKQTMATLHNGES